MQTPVTKMELFDFALGVALVTREDRPLVFYLWAALFFAGGLIAMGPLALNVFFGR